MKFTGQRRRRLRILLIIASITLIPIWVTKEVFGHRRGWTYRAGPVQVGSTIYQATILLQGGGVYGKDKLPAWYRIELYFEPRGQSRVGGGYVVKDSLQLSRVQPQYQLALEQPQGAQLPPQTVDWSPPPFGSVNILTWNDDGDAVLANMRGCSRPVPVEAGLQLNWLVVRGCVFKTLLISILLCAGAVSFIMYVTRDGQSWKRRYVCAECGYDLWGCKEPGCPECGYGRKATSDQHAVIETN